jgi:hypothetical protein
MHDTEQPRKKKHANLKDMKEELTSRLETKIKAKIKTKNHKFEVIQSALVSQTDIPKPEQRSFKK